MPPAVLIAQEQLVPGPICPAANDLPIEPRHVGITPHPPRSGTKSGVVPRRVTVGLPDITQIAHESWLQLMNGGGPRCGRFLVTACHMVCLSSMKLHLVTYLPRKQWLADRALTRRDRAGRLAKWPEMAVSGAFSSIRPLVDRAAAETLARRSSSNCIVALRLLRSHGPPTGMPRRAGAPRPPTCGAPLGDRTASRMSFPHRVRERG
jgi:hypothetical protein